MHHTTQKHTLCPDSKLAIHTSEDEKCPRTGQCTNVLIFWSPLPICAVLWAPSVHIACCATASANSHCLPCPCWQSAIELSRSVPITYSFIQKAAGSLTRFPLGVRAHQVEWSYLDPLRISICMISKNTFKLLQSLTSLLVPTQHCETWWISMARTQRKNADW